MLSSLLFFGKDFDSSFVDLGVFNKVKNSLSHILRGGYGENVRMLHMETWCIGTCTKFETWRGTYEKLKSWAKRKAALGILGYGHLC